MIEQFENFKAKFNNDISFPFKIISGIFLYCFIILVINILRNFNTGEVIYHLTNPPFTFMYFYYILSILIGTVVIYKLIRYYFEFHTVDYLLFSLFVFGTTVMIFSFHFFHEYGSNISQLLAEGRDDEFVRAAGIELTLAGRLIFWVGTFALFIYIVRLDHWRNYNIILKIFIVILAVDQIIRILMDFIFWMYMSTGLLSMLTWFPMTFNTGTSYLGTIGGFFYFSGLADLINSVLPIDLIELANPIYLIYFLLIFNILRSKSLGQSKSMKFTKFFWIIFGTVSILLVIIQQIVDLPYIGIVTQGVFSLIQMFFLLGILIMLMYGPELILITDPALFRAKRIYKVIENDHQPKSTKFITRFSQYDSRLKKYIESMPLETRNQIKLKEQAL